MFKQKLLPSSVSQNTKRWKLNNNDDNDNNNDNNGKKHKPGGIIENHHECQDSMGL